MPSFMIFALLGAPTVGGIWPVRSRESLIMRENMNQSKGLLQTLAVPQALERTGFFGANPAGWFPWRVIRVTFFVGRGPLLRKFRPLQHRSRHYPFFMLLKNSSLFLVARNLSSRNSVASSSSMPNRSFLRIHTLGRMSGGISSSSRRVPERFTLSDG